MPKKPGVHEDYIRFRLPEADKRAFEDAAKAMRISLSAWLRLAGLEKLEGDRDGSTNVRGARRGSGR